MVDPLHSTSRPQSASYANETPSSLSLPKQGAPKATVDQAAQRDSLNLSGKGELAADAMQAAQESDGVDAERVASIRDFISESGGDINPELVAASLLNAGVLSAK